MELGTTKRYCVSSTYSTNDSQHSSCRWDIWSHISECFQHLCRTIHHIEVYGTFDARHCKGFKNHCKRTVCCCCKSVALWSWQLAKGFKVGKSDSKDFSDREGCGCSLSSGIQQGLMVPADSWGTLLVFLSFTERVFCMLCCTCRIIKQEKAQITSFYATGRWKSLLWFINWEKAGILPRHTRRLFFQSKLNQSTASVQCCSLNDQLKTDVYSTWNGILEGVSLETTSLKVSHCRSRVRWTSELSMRWILK